MNQDTNSNDGEKPTTPPWVPMYPRPIIPCPYPPLVAKPGDIYTRRLPPLTDEEGKALGEKLIKEYREKIEREGPRPDPPPRPFPKGPMELTLVPYPAFLSRIIREEMQAKSASAALNRSPPTRIPPPKPDIALLQAKPPSTSGQESRRKSPEDVEMRDGHEDTGISDADDSPGDGEVWQFLRSQGITESDNFPGQAWKNKHTPPPVVGTMLKGQREDFAWWCPNKHASGEVCVQEHSCPVCGYCQDKSKPETISKANFYLTTSHAVFRVAKSWEPVEAKPRDNDVAYKNEDARRIYHLLIDEGYSHRVAKQAVSIPCDLDADARKMIRELED